MDLDSLRKLVSKGEGDHIEFKKFLPDIQKLLREALAFANAGGGMIFVGVDDDGSICGLKDPDECIEEFQKGLKNNCNPEFDFEVEQVAVTKKRSVVIFSIPQSRKKPHRLFSSNQEKSGLVFYRVKDMSIQASKELTQILKTEGKKNSIKIEFGEKEKLLLKLLEKKGKISIEEFIKVAGLKREIASRTLVHLVKGNVLRIIPSADGDSFEEVLK